MWHYKGDGLGTEFISEMEMTRKIYDTRTELRWPGTSWMDPFLEAYEQVYPNLTLHADGYPTAAMQMVALLHSESEMTEHISTC